LSRERSIVSVANDLVDIRFACSLIGLDVPEIPDGKSIKIHCPFGGVWHRDQGIEKAFRVYPSTASCYCFACAKYFSPVSLVATAWDRDEEEIAGILLGKIGYIPEGSEERWEQLVSHVPVVDTAVLAEALKMFCGRIFEDWSFCQFSDPFASSLGRCLALLPLVESEEQAVEWLSVSKRVMSSLFGVSVV
jgi:hypothetical protein